MPLAWQKRPCRHATHLEGNKTLQTHNTMAWQIRPCRHITQAISGVLLHAYMGNRNPWTPTYIVGANKGMNSSMKHATWSTWRANSLLRTSKYDMCKSRCEVTKVEIILPSMKVPCNWHTQAKVSSRCSSVALDFSFPYSHAAQRVWTHRCKQRATQRRLTKDLPKSKVNKQKVPLVIQLEDSRVGRIQVGQLRRITLNGSCLRILHAVNLRSESTVNN